MSLFSYVRLGGCVLSTALLLPAATRSQARSCPVGTPSAQSYTWNFQAEAQGLLGQMASEARQARKHADQLQALMSNGESDWESQAQELDQIRDVVNDMGRQLCRLEAIRRVTLPWGRKAIDQAAPLIAEMANDTEHAITFINHSQHDLFYACVHVFGTRLI